MFNIYISLPNTFLEYYGQPRIKFVILSPKQHTTSFPGHVAFTTTGGTQSTIIHVRCCEIFERIDPFSIVRHTCSIIKIKHVKEVIGFEKKV